MSERLPEEPGANPALLNLAGLDLSAGQRLAQARERAGLSHEQVADKLKLDAYTIVALENSDYRVIGAAVFVRGFLRRYAQLVGESPSEIEALYSRQPESALAPDLARVAIHAQRGHRPGQSIGLWPVAVAVGVLCAAAALWWATQRSTPPKSATSTEVIVSPGIAAPGVTPAAVAAPSAAPITAPAPAAAAAQESDEAALAARLAALPRKQLLLRFNDEVWAEVYDARGKRLQFGFAHAGSSSELVGTPPFRMVLGNASAVEVALEGVAISLPEAAPGERVRLTLNSKGVVTLRP
jgi:cytoskeleton protein RodZ